MIDYGVWVGDWIWCRRRWRVLVVVNGSEISSQRLHLVGFGRRISPLRFSSRRCARLLDDGGERI